MQFPQGISDVEFEWCPDDEEDITIPEPSVVITSEMQDICGPDQVVLVAISRYLTEEMLLRRCDALIVPQYAPSLSFAVA